MSKRSINFSSNYFGIGQSLSLRIKQNKGLNLNKPISFLNTDQKKRIQLVVENQDINYNLKSNLQKNIDFLKKSNSYRGERHKLKYPCRGQRTHTNAKTVKKKRN